MRYGFTTGSCAAAAAKAAAYMLLTGMEKTKISIDTPKGIIYKALIEEITREEARVSCAVRKDGGDDPDITTGALVFAEVRIETDDAKGKKAHIFIDGGVGVGRVTKPGLDQPVGNAAINHVPREMIEREVLQVCELVDFKGCLSVVISVPEGEALAGRTFNPRLGIQGGISILGTTGIVEPMSSKALLDTIRTELSVKKASGAEAVAVSPGNYGLDYMKRAYGYDLDKSVKCSNFIGDTIDMSAEAGFREMLLTGHIGKLIKLSGGMLNTHSNNGDCRMELLAAAGIEAGVDAGATKEILGCVATESAVSILKAAGRLEKAMDIVMEKAQGYLAKRADGRLRIECIMYANDYGELVRSEGAQELLFKIKNQELQ